jgi:hypothetical protein
MGALIAFRGRVLAIREHIVAHNLIVQLDRNRDRREEDHVVQEGADDDAGELGIEA